MAPRFTYSRWDGTQVGFELDAATIMDEITDDVLYHGDVNAALRRLMQQGFNDRNGERMQGLREMLDRLRERREETLDKYDLGGVFNEIAEALKEVVEQERAAVDQARQQAKQSGDPRREEVTTQAMGERDFQLDMLPSDLAGQVRELQQYEFVSPEARERFEELMEQLRQQVMQSHLKDMKGAMDNMSPEDMQRMKDMLADLNTMLEKHQRGEETDFEKFMEKYGDFFPENPQTVEELLEIMARRMAAMQQMLNSMTPEQRQQLKELSDQLMEDMDLRWQMDQLSQNLQQMFPQMGWQQGRDFQGDQPMGMAEAAGMMQELSDLDQLEGLLKGASNPGALAEADIERARQLLGEESARSLEQLAKMTRQLEAAGLIENKGGRVELTPKGLRKIGANALNEVFRKLATNELGRHQIQETGHGHERSFETKQYEFGDPFHLDIQRTIRNAISRTGGGSPVRLTPDDFEVERTEQTVKASTVLMIDLSLSMPMRDNFLPAKKVAMALHSLISSMYPRDYLGIVGFSETARKLTPAQLPEVSWDYVYGTNMQHGLMLARQMLARQSGTKQIIMITDGEPTAHLMHNGEVFFNYPPVRETVDATLIEVARATKEGIRINTFVLDATGPLRHFIEQLTKLNRGRAFFVDNQNLGNYVLVDFLEQRRAQSGGNSRHQRAS